LLRLEKEVTAAQPRVLPVAPMSGHFATLLRGTAQTLLADHDVYITDWHNARDIGPQHGRFDFDDFIRSRRHLSSGIGAGRPCRRRLPACVACSQR
jgi:poly(3-hydroxybutyrate) depolymerase